MSVFAGEMYMYPQRICLLSLVSFFVFLYLVEFSLDCDVSMKRECMDGLQPISRDKDNNAAMYKNYCWAMNKRS